MINEFNDNTDIVKQTPGEFSYSYKGLKLNPHELNEEQNDFVSKLFKDVNIITGKLDGINSAFAKLPKWKKWIAKLLGIRIENKKKPFIVDEFHLPQNSK